MRNESRKSGSGRGGKKPVAEKRYGACRLLLHTMDNPPSQEVQEKLRSYLQGWKEGSGTAKWYNQRFTQEKAMKFGLELQKGKIRIPENLA